MEALPVSAGRPETPVSFVDASYHQDVADLFRFTTQTTDRDWTVKHRVDTSSWVEPPDLLQENTVDAINQGGPALVDALADPNEARSALDSLTIIDTIRQAEPHLSEALALPMAELDNRGWPMVNALIEGDDAVASVKALRLVCKRAVMNDGTGITDLTPYISRIIALPAITGEAKAEAQLLYHDLLHALSSIMNEKTVHQSYHLFSLFCNSLGFKPSKLHKAWKSSTSFLSPLPKNTPYKATDWARRNIETMLTLERQEPGLSRNIHLTFNTHNFARRTPRMLADMYHRRMQHPDTPYLLCLSGGWDDNGVMADKGHAERFYNSVVRAGLRLEEHECTQTDDIERIGRQATGVRIQHGAEIVDLLITAHGSPWGVALRNNEPGFAGLDSELGMGHLRYLAHFRPALRKDARILIGSCLTGKFKTAGFAHGVAERTRHETVAARRKTAAIFTVRGRAGEPRADITYGAGAYFLGQVPLIGNVALALTTALNVGVKRIFTGEPTPDFPRAT